MIKNYIKKISKYEFFTILTFIFIFYGVFVRFQGLGYSNLQGDEINPLRYLGNIKGVAPSVNNFLNYILHQKRGPMQYIVNYINVYLFGYHNEFQVRLPFFIFGVVSFYTFYKLSKYVWESKKAALYTVLFLSLNGLFIAFSRITQYQAILHLLVPLSLYLFAVGYEKNDLKKITLSAVFLGVSVLSHYDALSTIAFFAIFLLHKLIWEKNYKKIFIYSTLFLSIFGLLSLSFYYPYFSKSYYSDNASTYISGRTSWTQLVPVTPLVLKLITMYAPIEYWFLLLVFIILGIFFSSFNSLNSLKILFIKISKKQITLIYSFLVTLLSFSIYFSYFYFKPRLSTLLFYFSSLSLVILLLFFKKVDAKRLGIVAWFLFSAFFYFFFIKDPRTHVYTVFMPGFILAGYGFYSILGYLKNIKYLYFSFLTVFLTYFIYLSGLYWFVFVNRNPEYPWWKKRYLGRLVYRVHRVRYKKIDGVFGFNQYRHWEKIRDLYDKGCLVGSYSSNEKNSITSFYVGFNQTPENEEAFKVGADTLVVVEGPHSWIYDGLREGDVPTYAYTLLDTFYNQDYSVTYIWGLKTKYPKGKMFCN